MSAEASPVEIVADSAVETRIAVVGWGGGGMCLFAALACAPTHGWWAALWLPLSVPYLAATQFNVVRRIQLVESAELRILRKRDCISVSLSEVSLVELRTSSFEPRRTMVVWVGRKKYLVMGIAKGEAAFRDGLLAAKPDVRFKGW